MERSRSFPKTLGFIAVLLLSIPVWVGTRTAVAQELTTRFGIAGQVGGCLPAMNDLNRQIRAGNDFLLTRGWKPLGEVKIGYNFTGDFRARVHGPIWASLGVGHVFGKTGVDFDQVITVKPSGSFYQLHVLCDLPFRPRPRMLLRLGAGPVDMPTAKVHVEHQVRSPDLGILRLEKADFKGKGWGAHGFLEAEYILNSKTTLVADLGYRYLKVKRDSFVWGISGIQLPESDSDGNGVPAKYDLDEKNGIIANAFLEIVKDEDGRPHVVNAAGLPEVVPRGMNYIDFSGPLLNVGLRFYLF